MVSGCPLLHLVHQLVNYWSDQGACLDLYEWVSTPPSWSDPCIGLVRPGGISGLRQVGVHSSILVRQLASLPVGPEACLDSDEWVSTPLSWSDPCLGLVRPGASLDSDKWVSTPPSWSDGLHHYWLDEGHVWTWMSGYPLLHPGLTPVQDWSDQGASLNSDEWVSTPPSWSDGLHHYWSD